ncbi:MAG: hypothetical protein K2N16_05660 [Muribaculaceae bacterium]|nr:hypothetical protein [Muribaculaceae bacterium]
MDDDKIKDILKGYRPELTPDFRFMASLERKMEAVEYVKQEMRALRRRNKIAMAVATVAGFVMGALTTLLAPLVTGWASTSSLAIPSTDIAIDLNFLIYITAALVSALSAYNAYEITLARLGRRQNL